MREIIKSKEGMAARGAERIERFGLGTAHIGIEAA